MRRLWHKLPRSRSLTLFGSKKDSSINSEASYLESMEGVARTWLSAVQVEGRIRGINALALGICGVSRGRKEEQDHPEKGD